MKYILLTKHKRAIVDDIDYDYLIQFKWLYLGGIAGIGYAARAVTIRGIA